IYSIVGGSRATIFQAVFIGPLISMTGSKKMGLMMWKPNKKEDLAFIKELIESGKVVPTIDRRYPLSEVAEALRYFEEGHPQGKIVITMEHNDKPTNALQDNG
ncbi:MAG: zinc-binding dehydrogenase, partial [Candidatus Lokiarchaeota archaeon]|nr:zinc-binding dehydrogenase [Candidatus Lokiarchaeota archaeon]